MIIFVGAVLMIALFGGMGYMTYKAIKQTDPNNNDSTVKDDISKSQDFLPFEDIKDGMILMGGHKYRAIIECSSTNYNLKTDKEKELIEISFQRFVNSISFPITFFIQTKVIDNSKMLESLKLEVQETIKNYPNLQNYANEYYDEMLNLHSRIGNNKQKKKYIIVPYEEAITLNNLSDEEKYEHSTKELLNRCNILQDGLNSIGVKTKVLNTKEVAELVYSTYHKDNYSYIDQIVNGEGLSLLVEGEGNKLNNLSADAILDWILYEAEIRLQNEVLQQNTSDIIKQNGNKCLEVIEKLRNDNAGYYKDSGVKKETVSLKDAF